MLGDEQKQSVERGALAIQVGGDLSIHGLHVADVREICTLLFDKNFPKVIEAARQTAEQHTREFIEHLDSRLVQRSDSIDFQKFYDPDVEACINDAIQASARKGPAAHPDILSSLLAARVGKQSSDFQNIVFSESVSVVPKLTPAQISFLALSHFVLFMPRLGIKDLGELEPYAQEAMEFCMAGFGLSEGQRRHLVYAGTCSIGSAGGDIYKILLANAYRQFAVVKRDDLVFALQHRAPTYAALVAEFATRRMIDVRLTSVGQAIAIAHIKNHCKVIPEPKYETWLS